MPLRVPLRQCRSRTCRLSGTQRGRAVSIPSNGMLTARARWPALNSPGLRTSIIIAPFFKCASASLAEICPARFSRKKAATTPPKMRVGIQFQLAVISCVLVKIHLFAQMFFLPLLAQDIMQMRAEPHRHRIRPAILVKRDGLADVVHHHLAGIAARHVLLELRAD